MIAVKVVRVDESVNLPVYKTKGASGMDLQAFLPNGPMTLHPRCRATIPTGLVMEIPEGFEGQVRSRSGCAKHNGIVVLPAPGTIDSDFRGEISVLIINHGQAPIALSNGDRIAQIVFAAVERAEFVSYVEVNDLTETDRGDGGFGSTGTDG